MAARNRLPPWHEMQHLSNGRDVLIRPIRPDDAQPLRAAFPLLEPDEVRLRMQSSMPELSVEMADKLSRPDPRSEFAIVVAEPLPPGEALVGAVARATIVPGGRDVEFAILVSRYIAGMGAGPSPDAPTGALGAWQAGGSHLRRRPRAQPAHAGAGTVAGFPSRGVQ